MNAVKRILVTGASGFIGSYIVEKALDENFEVWVAVRSTSSLRYLTDQRIHFLDLDFSDEKKLTDSLSSCKEFCPQGWDYIVHAAGITKGKSDNDFIQVNYEGTKRLVHSLRNNHLLPKRFVYLSSLSVLGSIRQEREKTGGYVYAEMKEQDIACPNTAYGKSKLMAEDYLVAQNDLDVVILRPTGVYGPREKDYFLMVKSIANHVDFSAGFYPQEITFVYVKDLVDAIFIVMDKGERNRKYFVSDGRTYSSRDFSDLIQKEMGVAFVVHIIAPLLVLKLVCTLGSWMAKLTGRMTALNKDKYHILKQRNWRCDISPIEQLGYCPKYDLAKGTKETVAWYQREKWI